MMMIRKVMALACLLLVLVVVACTPARKVPSEKTLIKCTTCGVEFTVDEGMKAYEAAHNH
jgi:hypothetical protein